MESIASLLNPRSIAVVGASPRGGRGIRTLANLRDTAFAGEVFAVNPRYEEVLGFKCHASVGDLPVQVDCLVVAVGADAACDVLESAHGFGIRAAVVLAAGFGEGGHGNARTLRLSALAAKGMSICGPNCYGLLSIKPGAVATAYSGRLPQPLRPGAIALVSQSGGLGNSVYTPLMADRELGFRYVVSCGNQIGTAIEDYIEHFAGDPGVAVIAAIVEQVKNPRKLLRVARLAHAQGKPLIFFQVGRSAAGQVMIHTHTGALVSNAEILAAHLRRCGIVSVDSYDAFVEAIELFAVAPRERETGREVIVVSGSGGGAAIAADALDGTGMTLPAFPPATQERIKLALPEFGNVTNPIDGTGSMSDDPAVLPKLFDAILACNTGRAMIATTVTARGSGNEKERRFANILADTARASGRTMVAFQHSPLGGPLDSEIVRTLHTAQIPLLLGGTNAMRVLHYLPLAGEHRARVLARDWANDERLDARVAAGMDGSSHHWSFLDARRALVAGGVAVVDAKLASTEADAVAIARTFGGPVALKAEAQGLLHKSDVGCVRLNCTSESEIAEAYRAVTQNARTAGCRIVDGVLVQPMVSGITEAFAGIINDPACGPAICFGLGGIFVEILKDTVTEMAPLTRNEALEMIHRLKAAPILLGARGRAGCDIAALADLLVKLGDFAVENFGRFRALDLNPIIVGPPGGGAVAVDIAVEPAADKPLAAARTA